MAFDFNAGYDRGKFMNFLRTDLFGDKFTQELTPIRPERKTAFFVENGIYQLGTVQLGDEEVYVIEIKQSSKNDPRVTLTQDAFKIMGDLLIDNAIVALYVDNNSSWRFSLLTTKYEDFKKTTSNPKRFSFILGPNEKIRTVNQQLIKKGKINNFEDLVSRFDVEVVRKEFFETYLELFVRLYKEILKDKSFSDLLTSQNVDLVSFTKNLLGKIIFLYFVQQKGWLGLGRNTTTKYGEGNKDFMRKLWINFKEQKESLCTHEKTGYFYNDYLEWLFYAGLNIDRRNNGDRFDQLQMKLPYLNGGLFKEEYEGWKDNIAKVNNDIFSNKDEDGILDIFDRYNFTIDEDSLYDTDIAVDPEMLGRIFEKMISISSKNIGDVLTIYDKKKTNAKFDFGKDLNKKLGAFYTPREIVHYITKESLINYLQDKTNLSEENIRILFELKEKFLLDSKDMKRAEYSEEALKMIGNCVVDVDEALKNVKVLDPAVGSGAFPMGLLHEISSLRYYMYGVFNKIFENKSNNFKTVDGKISLYKIKKDIILNNIHGIDIDPGAIDIAKLRFRLSLVVDEQEPEPLPNFEFKFICADSLIHLEEGSLFTKAEVIEKLKNLRDEYYKCDDKDEKNKLKNKFYDIKRELTGFGKSRADFKSAKEWNEYLIQSYSANSDQRNRQILEWDPFETKEYNKWSDTELMMGQDKFDIVIGNPPYVDMGKMDKSFRDKFQGDSANVNLYTLFIKSGLSLLKPGGNLSFITQNSFLFSIAYTDFRKELIEKTNMLIINDYGPGVFENAEVATCSFLFKNKETKSEYCKLKVYHKFNLFREIDATLYLKNHHYVFSVYNDVLDDDIISKIESSGNVLEKYISITRGIEVISAEEYSPTNIYADYKELLLGKQSMDRYYIKEVQYLKYKKGKPSYKGEDLFLKKKLMIPEGASKIIAIPDSTGIFTTRSIYCCVENSCDVGVEYLAAIVNSKLYDYYVKKMIAGNTGYVKIRIDNIKYLPIKISTNMDQFIKKIEEIFKVTNNMNLHDEVIEEYNSIIQEIDEMVYQLYGLTKQEIQIVEDSLK